MIESKSTFRWATNRALRGMQLDGKVLDVGGDRHSDYHREFIGAHSIEFANISDVSEPDFVFDVQAPWPVGPGAYDAVLMFNLLEHVYDYRAALAHAHTALGDDGRLLGVVPFLFMVHASPSDYFRFTGEALHRTLADAGFENVTITPLGTGVFSVIYQALSGPAPPMLVPLGRSLFLGLDRLLARLKPGNKFSVDYYPLGYLFAARKRGG